jgi:hypothetical protein
VIAVNIHFPFYLAAAALIVGIVVLATGHRLLGDAERAQAEEARGSYADRRGRTESTASR